MPSKLVPHGSELEPGVSSWVFVIVSTGSSKHENARDADLIRFIVTGIGVSREEITCKGGYAVDCLLLVQLGFIRP